MRIRRVLVLGLLVALSATGCARDDSGGEVATAGGTTPSATASTDPASGPDDREAIFSYAKCMRENGVPDFPDPEVGDNGEFRIALPQGTAKEKVDAAQEKCKKLLPNGGEPGKADPERVDQLRRYAQCMRENGVPRFPDPTDQGLQIKADELGVDPEGSTMKAAEEKCRSLLPEPPGGEKPRTERREG